MDPSEEIQGLFKQSEQLESKWQFISLNNECFITLGIGTHYF